MHISTVTVSRDKEQPNGRKGKTTTLVDLDPSQKEPLYVSNSFGALEDLEENGDIVVPKTQFKEGKTPRANNSSSCRSTTAGFM